MSFQCSRQNEKEMMRMLLSSVVARRDRFILSLSLSIQVPAYPNWKYRLPTTSELAKQEQTLLTKPIKEGLNSVPISQKEKHDCAVRLSPSQLFKVVVGKIEVLAHEHRLYFHPGPPELNFGEVCVHAPITKYLSVLNNLDQFVLVQIDVCVCRDTPFSLLD